MTSDPLFRHQSRKTRAAKSGPKSLRIDRPFEAEPTPEPVELPRARLIDMLRRAISGNHGERRSSVRHDVANSELWIGWWTDDHFGANRARLLNLSRGGARVVMTNRPPKREPVWLYKEVGTTLSFVRGDLVGVTPAPGGLFCARFRFSTHCPTLLCQALICETFAGPTAEAVNEFRPER